MGHLTGTVAAIPSCPDSSQNNRWVEWQTGKGFLDLRFLIHLLAVLLLSVCANQPRGDPSARLLAVCPTRT
jgi:hypothetical protein